LECPKSAYGTGKVKVSKPNPVVDLVKPAQGTDIPIRHRRCVARASPRL